MDQRVEHYHSKNYTLQQELAAAALQLAREQRPARPNDLFLDFGCGSGLSTQVALEKLDRFVVGGDIAHDMLQKIDRKALKRVDPILFDFGKRWPFRENVFDEALSISAVQWLYLENACNKKDDKISQNQPNQSTDISKEYLWKRLFANINRCVSGATAFTILPLGRKPSQPWLAESFSERYFSKCAVANELSAQKGHLQKILFGFG